MRWERVTLRHFTAKLGTLQRESADSDKALFKKKIKNQYLTRMFSVLVKKIWLVVQGKGPINDDMKEQRESLNLEITVKNSFERRVCEAQRRHQ